MNFEARLEKIKKQLELLRFPNKSWHLCGERFGQFWNSVDTVMENCRIVVVCQLLKGRNNLICFNRGRGILTTEMLLTRRAVLFVFSWKCTVTSSWTPVIMSWPTSVPEFVLSGCGRCLLQDEDHPGSRPHSFLDLCQMCSGTSPERFRSSPEVAGSWGSHQDVLMCQVCGFLFC